MSRYLPIQAQRGYTHNPRPAAPTWSWWGAVTVLVWMVSLLITGHVVAALWRLWT